MSGAETETQAAGRRLPGCCVDRRYFERTGRGDGGCDENTCMTLPEGRTCGDCVHEARCTTMFGAKSTDDHCGFFPRRFRLPVIPEKR